MDNAYKKIVYSALPDFFKEYAKKPDSYRYKRTAYNVGYRLVKTIYKLLTYYFDVGSDLLLLFTYYINGQML